MRGGGIAKNRIMFEPSAKSSNRCLRTCVHFRLYNFVHFTVKVRLYILDLELFVYYTIVVLYMFVYVKPLKCTKIELYII